MNRTIQFFSYEQCYKYYTKRIMNIRQAKIHGETIVAKPVLMVAIIDGIGAAKEQKLWPRIFGERAGHSAHL